MNMYDHQRYKNEVQHAKASFLNRPLCNVAGRQHSNWPAISTLSWYVFFFFLIYFVYNIFFSLLIFFIKRQTEKKDEQKYMFYIHMYMNKHKILFLVQNAPNKIYVYCTVEKFMFVSFLLYHICWKDLLLKIDLTSFWFKYYPKTFYCDKIKEN